MKIKKDKREVSDELIKTLLQANPSSILGGMAVVLLIYIPKHVQQIPWLGTLVLLFTAFSALRLAVLLGIKRSGNVGKQTILYWLRSSSFVAALLFALMVYVINSQGKGLDVISVVGALGLMSGAMYTLSMDVRAFLSFVLPILIALIITFSSHSYDVLFSFTGMAVIYFAIILRATLVQNDYYVELVSKREELKELSTKDFLTGLLNRSGLYEAFEQRNQGTFSILFVDLDNFKKVNDVHGHLAGDELLKAISSVISAGEEANIVASRFGGDEFVLLAYKPTEDVGTYVAKLGQELNDKCRDMFPDIPGVGVSIGVAHFGAITALDTALGQADAAVYKAKKAGKNTVRIAGDATAV